MFIVNWDSFFDFIIFRFLCFFLFRLDIISFGWKKNGISKFINHIKIEIKKKIRPRHHSIYTKYASLILHDTRTNINWKMNQKKNHTHEHTNCPPPVWFGSNLANTYCLCNCKTWSGHNPPQTGCQPGEFECKNLKRECIPMAMVCDGINDCIDRSDELNCADVDHFVRHPNRTKKDEASKSANIIGLFNRKKNIHITHPKHTTPKNTYIQIHIHNNQYTLIIILPTQFVFKPLYFISNLIIFYVFTFDQYIFL